MKDVIIISQVPTYITCRSNLWFKHSVEKEYTIRKNEDGQCYLTSGLISVTEEIEDVIDMDGTHGWGPVRETYTLAKPAPKVVFNSITDNSYLDERYFVSATEYTGDPKKNHWTDYTYVEEGHKYAVRAYVHNNAASNLQLSAEDVRVYFSLPNYYARAINVVCEIICPNADPTSYWDSTTFYSDDSRPFALSYVEDSLRYYNNAGTFRLQNESEEGAPIFTTEGVLLGFDEMNGTIPGCIYYAGYISFLVEPVFQD